MDLYQAILNRRSVRRYQAEPLDKEVLQQVDEIIHHAKGLVTENRFRVMLRDAVTGEDLIAAMGGYGRILTPPHYLVAHIVGQQFLLVDLAYRMEQIAVQMAQIGINNCFIGSLNRESNVRVRFRLTSNARIGAFLIFGHAAESVTGRTLNAVIRRAAGGTNKMPADELFFDTSFNAPTTPPKELRKLIEAGRRAPSANNSQPWRFLWQDPVLYLFLMKENPRYGQQVYQEYRYFDGGACMSNIAMALETLDLSGKWSLFNGREAEIPEHPENMEPLARLLFS